MIKKGLDILAIAIVACSIIAIAYLATPIFILFSPLILFLWAIDRIENNMD